MNEYLFDFLYEQFRIRYPNAVTEEYEDIIIYTEEQKKSLPSKAPVINCHIQYGADLDPQAVERSFHKAWEFFQTYYPDIRFRAFLCGSWL